MKSGIELSIKLILGMLDPEDVAEYLNEIIDQLYAEIYFMKKERNEKM